MQLVYVASVASVTGVTIVASVTKHYNIIIIQYIQMNNWISSCYVLLIWSNIFKTFLIYEITARRTFGPSPMMQNNDKCIPMSLSVKAKSLINYPFERKHIMHQHYGYSYQRFVQLDDMCM